MSTYSGIISYAPLRSDLINIPPSIANLFFSSNIVSISAPHFDYWLLSIYYD